MAVQITALICGTIILLAIINLLKKDDKNSNIKINTPQNVLKEQMEKIIK